MIKSDILNQLQTLWKLSDWAVMVSRKVLTLVLVTRPNQVLLGMKKRGFGEGWWNGFGGKVEKGETIIEAAKRELQEECCLTANTLTEVGQLDFEFVGDPQILEVHLFTTKDVSGVPTETSEMKPQWFDIDKIPFHKMWPDDKLWFPHVLKGSKFSAFFLFEGHHKILKHKIDVVTEQSHIDSEVK
ncbi:hypothetical protein FSP39_014783 [Pinctada imbricata]|uniref:Oxidized purine nucleoside triphosphate hydrolase n=1 Tax=Pinctada imbricata TaxID=66713 RepID=A0AA88XSG1_PINIB|nr:hypothetical protein FSP39_014783 [Pinctada imbricata]